MSEQNKIDDLFKRNEAGLNRTPSDTAWSKLDRMLPKESDEKAVVPPAATSPLEERIKSFEKPNPYLVKGTIPAWVRYAAVLAILSIPVAAFFAIQNNSSSNTTTLAESKKTTEDFSDVIAMNEPPANGAAAKESYTIDGVAIEQSAIVSDGTTGGSEEEIVQEVEAEEQSKAARQDGKKAKRKRFGNIDKMKSSNGNTGTTRPPVLKQPTVPASEERLNPGTTLPSPPQAALDTFDVESFDLAISDDHQNSGVHPFVQGFPEGPGGVIVTNGDIQFKNPHPSASKPSITEDIDEVMDDDTFSEEVLSQEETPIVLEEIADLGYYQSDKSLDEETQVGFKKESGVELKESNDQSVPNVTQSMGNFVRVKHDLSKYYGHWLDEEGQNTYNIIRTGPNTASVDVYREDQLSRNYQLMETVDGLGLMLYDNEANTGTTEYLLQSTGEKMMQFFLPSDPTNFVRFELKKKKLVVTEQQSASASKTFRLKKIE